LKINYCCTYWGCEQDSPNVFVDKVLAAGYEGIEISLPPTPETFTPHFLKELENIRKDKPNFIFIAQHLTSPGTDSVEQYIRNMEKNLLELCSYKPTFINSHTGKDFYSFDDNCRVLEAALTMSQKTGVRILHETHRCRFSFHTAMLLPYLEKFPEFKKFSNIIYTDHKFQLLDSHIQKLHNIYISNPTEIIIIRKTPKNKTNIFDEINEAKFQERYLKNMNETIEFVQNKIDTGEINSDIRISNTGIIYYNNFTQIIPFLNNIYNTCMELQQPECQIFWAVYCQKYLNYINQIEFNEVNPIWKEP
jgi:hypothetical protein